MAVSGRLVALAALGLLLVPLPPTVLGSYALLLVLAVVADLVRAAPIRDLGLSRDPVGATRLGTEARTTLRITNNGRRILRATVRDAWVPSAGSTPRAQPVRVPAGERRTVVSTLVPTRRGERPAAEVTIRSFGPLGLAARQRRTRAPAVLRVLPPFTARRFLPEKLARLRQLDGAVVLHQRGPGSEFDSLREYVVGDDVRAIDWRATARSRDVVVRTWRPERDRQIVLALDTGRTSAARIGDEPRLDAAIDAGLLLGALAARAGDRISLVAADIAVRARIGAVTGPDVLPKLVRALTPLQPALVETDPQLLAGEVLRRTGKRALIVLVTSLDVAAPELGVFAAVRALVARHEVIVGSVTDPRLAELAADPDDPYTAAAAEQALAGQASLAARLVRMGVQVVAAPPQSFASTLADRYLDLKAAGRL